MESSLRVKISVGDIDVLTKTHRVTLLPINEWVDDDETRHFLPSFVFPLDPAVERIIDAAQSHLYGISDNPTAGFDGYQQVDFEDEEIEDPTAPVDYQVMAIWRALLDLSIGYINPPPTFTKESQRLRTPSRVIDGGRGTCIDLALLLASCLEYIEIYPVIFLLHGHAFPGYWRSEQDWERFVEGMEFDQDPMEVKSSHQGVGEGDIRSGDVASQRWIYNDYRRVRDYVEGGALVPMESVWMTTNTGYYDALDSGWENLAVASEFHSLIDVYKARKPPKPVTPLPLGIS